MNEDIKWKYSKNNLNFSKLDDEQNENKELLENIDKIKKEELKKIFDNTLNHNYDLYKKYLFEINLFMFSELENNIKESVYCLMIGAHTASITNTNLILERALKLALIQYESGKLIDYSDNKSIKSYVESDKIISDKSIDKNIQRCQKYKMLNKEEATELKKYKLKYRDGFSHFTPRNILKGENRIFNNDEKSSIENYSNEDKLPPSQSIEIKQFAKNNSENHLIYVLKVINHLQFKVQEEFKNK